MSNGRSLVAGVALTLVALALVPITAPSADARPRRPDVLLIITDDQRDGTLGWLPALRRHMRERGVVFTRAMVPTSLCCPSRASILTGRFAHGTKVWSNDEGWTRFRRAGMESETVAVWLRRVGYRTGLVGKYLNGFAGTSAPRGWTVWHSFTGVNGAYYDYALRHGNGTVTWYGSGSASYSTDVLRRYAVRFIETTPSDRPLFLYFAPYAPHVPATPAPRHLSLSAPLRWWQPPSLTEDLSDKPPWIRGLPPVNVSKIQSQRVQEYRSLRAVDEAITAMFDAQRARGRLANTLVIVVSDDGPMWGEHRVIGKFVPYQGATRVPLAIAWPARLAGGRRDGRISLNIDLSVTIAAAAGAPHDPVAGRSLLRSWSRAGFVLEAARVRVAPGANGTNVARPAYCGWRTRRYLFVRYGNGREELYDYARDPWELQDRRGRRPDLQRRLRRKTRAACQPVPPGFSW